MNRFNKKKMVAYGYWEVKYSNGKPWYKCTHNNEILLGYRKQYHENGKIECKRINI